MNREDIIRIAREAGLLHESDTAEIIADCGVEIWLSPLDGANALERFAALVAAAEREACAKVCEEVITNDWEGAIDCAAAIRARGNT